MTAPSQPKICREFCLGVERVPNPEPARNDGGDCFACALCAGLRWLFPNREIALDEVWEFFLSNNLYYGDTDAVMFALKDAAYAYLANPSDERLEILKSAAEAIPDKKKPLLNNTWTQFEKAVHCAGGKYGSLEVTVDTVEPKITELRTWSFPWPERCAQEYCRRLEGWLRGGWVAFTEIDHAGKGPAPMLPDGRMGRNSINHFCILDGVRRVYTEHRDEAGHFKHGGWHDELHCVDSARTDLTGWHKADDFIRKHGAGAWWLARPREAGE